MTKSGEYEEGRHDEIALPVVIGVLHDSLDEPRRVRLLDTDGEERARLSGVLTFEEGEGWVRLSAQEGDGLVAALTIPLDPDTRCTISSEGTMTGTLPDGSMWMTTSLGASHDLRPIADLEAADS